MSTPALTYKPIALGIGEQKLPTIIKCGEYRLIVGKYQFAGETPFMSNYLVLAVNPHYFFRPSITNPFLVEVNGENPLIRYSDEDIQAMLRAPQATEKHFKLRRAHYKVCKFCRNTDRMVEYGSGDNAVGLRKLHRISMEGHTVPDDMWNKIMQSNEFHKTPEALALINRYDRTEMLAWLVEKAHLEDYIWRVLVGFSNYQITHGICTYTDVSYGVCAPSAEKKEVERTQDRFIDTVIYGKKPSPQYDPDAPTGEE